MSLFSGPDEPLTYTELQIFHSQECEISKWPTTEGRRGKTYYETTRELGVSESSIKRTKKKREYNALAQSMLEEKEYGIENYVQDLIDLTKADKDINVSGKLETVPDNPVRFSAVSEIGDIYGAKAPKQVDLQHSMAAKSDDELIQELDESAKEIENNGRIRNQITGSLDAGKVITSTVIGEEPGVAVESRE